MRSGTLTPSLAISTTVARLLGRETFVSDSQREALYASCTSWLTRPRSETL